MFISIFQSTLLKWFAGVGSISAASVPAALGWAENSINTYPTKTIAYELQQNQGVWLLGENADPAAWAGKAMEVLHKHPAEGKEDLVDYSIPFQVVVADMKQNKGKHEELKVQWGQNLKAVCLSSYRQTHNDFAIDAIVKHSVQQLCSVEKIDLAA